MNTEKLSAVLGAVMFFSMPAAAIANIVEIWTESGVAYRCKWTALTVFMTAFIMGLLIQTGHEPSKK
jgi:hypothetical protein